MREDTISKRGLINLKVIFDKGCLTDEGKDDLIKVLFKHLEVHGDKLIVESNPHDTSKVKSTSEVSDGKD